jgi:hypothetical protein
VDAFIGVLFALIVLMAVDKVSGSGANASANESSDRHSV